MSNKQSTLKDTAIIIGSLGLAYMTCGASAPLTLIASSTAGRIGAGAIGRQLDKWEMEKILGNWQRKDLNHDLQKALIAAIEQTFDHLKARYYSRQVAWYRWSHRYKVNAFFKRLKKEIGGELDNRANVRASEENIRQLLQDKEVADIIPDLLQEFCNRAKVYSPKLADILAKNLEKKIPFYFKEVLKNKDYEKAYKAFELASLKAIEKKIDEIDEKLDQSLKHHETTHGKLDQIIDNQPQSIPPLLTNNAPPLPKYFLGRENDLKNISKHLQKEKNLLLLNGIGGVGKSTAAAAYWDIHKTQYDHMAWVMVPDGEGEAESKLQRAFLEFSPIASSLNIPDSLVETPKRWRAVLNALHNLEGNNLLVLDNANDTAVLRYIQQHLNFPNFTKIITSRNQLTNFPSYRIEVLPMDKAKALFIKHYPQAATQDQLLTKLLTAIERHTLAIELLAKNLAAARSYTLEMLYEDLHKKGILQIKNRKIDTPYQKQNNIEPTAIIKAMFDIQPLSEDEQWLLLQFAVLPPIFISYKNIFTFLQITSEQEADFENTLNDLIKKGWLEENTDKDYQLHPIIQAVIKEKIPPTYENCQLLVHVLANKLNKCVTNNPLDGAKYVPYATSLVENIAEEDTNIATLANNLSLRYGDLGDLQKALLFQNKALKIYEKIYDKHHPSLATSYNNLSSIYQALGDLQKALNFQNKALKIDEKIYDKNHPYLATSYNNLSGIYQDLGDLQKALNYQNKTIDIEEKIYDKHHPSLATSYNNLSLIYKDLGDLQKALNFQNKANDIYENVLEDTHPLRATSYNNLSLIYKDLGDLQKALNFQNKANDIYENVLEDTHPLRATSYNNLSLIYKDLGDLQKALNFQNKANDIYEKIYDKHHPSLAGSYINLASIYLDMEKLALAKEYIDKAVGIYQYKFPNGHPHLTNALGWQEHITEQYNQQ